MTTPKVITRFAPSPTGDLHIGGARTALFNWLFARNMGGHFRLRVEDTDKARSTPEATQVILDGMHWLGLDHDDDIVFQSHNIVAHKAAAYDLLARGGAYKCYASDAEIEALRAQARDNGTAFRSPWRDTDKAMPEAMPYAIRFKVPDGQTLIRDHVQGDITWHNKEFDDLVLLRTDGTPTYMLAVVVDDHDMGVTHVIRGDDHLINAGRQQLIYNALNWPVPEWAHVPLIHGPDGKKLSKRHGAQAVTDFQAMGYMPEGLRNYLLKLGWSEGDKELYFGDEAIEAFTLSGINAAPARLDFDKLDYINGEHLHRADEDMVLSDAIQFLETENGGQVAKREVERIKLAMPSLKARSKTYKNIAEQAAYLMLNRPLDLSDKLSKLVHKEDANEHLKNLLARFENLSSDLWTAEKLHGVLQDYAEDSQTGFGKFGQPLRAALTAGHASPDLSDVLFYLGQTESIGRIQDVLI